MWASVGRGSGQREALKFGVIFQNYALKLIKIGKLLRIFQKNAMFSQQIYIFFKQMGKHKIYYIYTQLIMLVRGGESGAPNSIKYLKKHYIDRGYREFGLGATRAE